MPNKRGYGENMDTFRAAVRAALEGGEAPVFPEPAPTPAPPVVDDYVLYTVKAGDTLWAIARDRLGTGTRYKEIMALNGLPSEIIRVGQTLRLPE